MLLTVQHAGYIAHWLIVAVLRDDNVVVVVDYCRQTRS